MLYHFVILPSMGLFLLVGGVWLGRTAAGVPARSITDPPARVPLIVIGWGCAAAGFWLLLSAGINACSMSSVKAERVEDLVRREMREEHGVDPQNLHLSPDGWGRFRGAAELRGVRLDLAAELVVESGGARIVWRHTPSAEQ